MELLKDLKWRYAVKKFDATKSVSEEQVQAVLEAGNLAATSVGLQAFKMVLVKDKSTIAKLAEVSWGEQLNGASCVIVLASCTNVDATFVKDTVDYTRTVRPMVEEKKLKAREQMIVGYLKGLEEQGKKEAWLDNQVYIVLGTMLDACANGKIDCCPMEGIQKDKYDEILDLASLQLKTVVALPLGYRAEDDHHQDLPKVRRPLDEMVVVK